MATAAHCVCMSSSAMDEESLVDCEGGEIKYDAAKVIEVFVGLNTQDINVAIERNRDLHQRQVEKVRKVLYNIRRGHHKYWQKVVSTIQCIF